MTWRVLFTRQAQKDARKLASASPALKANAERLIALLKENPYQQPPPYEALLGDLKGACSRRINIQHRLVYQVLDDEQIVKVLRLWSHYD
ncbi:Txe/YoeB family addiction module toxin [Synechococcus sp. RS9916]|uniref:Txe/YoeB family addiction module toxin n=1 Tax=Synechococcus sp. RS9916 TaxID=221359 RepID=UPI0000E5355A|nr:Txe/YoeB family addiction module toxin [Synechococcus sp. RS9916]EAU74657.1 hypothetical protein RS9916_34157 [Synechococcus sp. RS9916]